MKKCVHRNIFSGLSIIIGSSTTNSRQIYRKKYEHKEFYRLDTVLDKKLTQIIYYIPTILKLLKHCALIAFKTILNEYRIPQFKISCPIGWKKTKIYKVVWISIEVSQIS